MFSFLKAYARIEVADPCRALPRPTEIYHAAVNSADYRSRGAERPNEQHCIFHYTVQGSGEVIYEGKAYKTTAGQGFFNIINDPLSGYGYPANGTEPWEFVVICFDGGNTRVLTKELLDRQVVYDLSGEAGTFEKLCADLSRPLLTRDMGTSFIFRLMEMLRSQQPCFYVTEFCRIARRDVMKNPTIFSIAEEIGISREHLQREFRRNTDSSPAQYLARLRLEALCQLLCENYSEAEIARMMNFPSASGVSLFFKKHTGITPRKYRERKYLHL